MIDKKKSEKSIILTLIAAVSVVVIIFVGAIKLIGAQEITSDKRFMNDIELKVEQVLDYKPSKERASFLVLAREVTLKDKITYNDSSKLNELFDKAENTEFKQEAASKKIEVSRKVEAALNESSARI